MATAIKEPAVSTDPSGLNGWTDSWSARRRPPTALRELDQEAVDRIVWAMTVAGLENAVELAELAMEETQFGVLEDKVLKNYIATEFLYDYLRDKKSVGVIDEDRERRSSTSPSRSGSCWRCCRSQIRRRRRCSSRSSAPRPGTR